MTKFSVSDVFLTDRVFSQLVKYLDPKNVIFLSLTTQKLRELCTNKYNWFNHLPSDENFSEQQRKEPIKTYLKFKIYQSALSESLSQLRQLPRFAEVLELVSGSKGVMLLNEAAVLKPQGLIPPEFAVGIVRKMKARKKPVYLVLDDSEQTSRTRIINTDCVSGITIKPKQAQHLRILERLNQLLETPPEDDLSSVCSHHRMVGDFLLHQMMVYFYNQGVNFIYLPTSHQIGIGGLNEQAAHHSMISGITVKNPSAFTSNEKKKVAQELRQIQKDVEDKKSVKISPELILKLLNFDLSGEDIEKILREAFFSSTPCQFKKDVPEIFSKTRNFYFYQQTTTTYSFLLNLIDNLFEHRTRRAIIQLLHQASNYPKEPAKAYSEYSTVFSDAKWDIEQILDECLKAHDELAQLLAETENFQEEELFDAFRRVVDLENKLGLRSVNDLIAYDLRDWFVEQEKLFEPVRLRHWLQVYFQGQSFTVKIDERKQRLLTMKAILEAQQQGHLEARKLIFNESADPSKTFFNQQILMIGNIKLMTKEKQSDPETLIKEIRHHQSIVVALQQIYKDYPKDYSCWCDSTYDEQHQFLDNLVSGVQLIPNDPSVKSIKGHARVIKERLEDEEFLDDLFEEGLKLMQTLKRVKTELVHEITMSQIAMDYSGV